MDIAFSKNHGLGNDFVMIDDRSNHLDLTIDQVQWICDRHRGVGADGVILIRDSPRPECAAYMHYINSDGSLAQMCGNGVRCFAKYLLDHGIVPKDSGSFIADTLAGPRPIDFVLNDAGEFVCATVTMGSPILEPSLVPVDTENNAVSDEGVAFVGDLPLDSPWGEFRFTCVSMGNPHAVCFIENWERISDDLFADPSDKNLGSFDVNRVGSYFESHPIFPEKANIEFATVGADGITMRVYERGCGETLACGTGACAVSVAASLTHRSSRKNIIHLLGGDLNIEWKDDGNVSMTGPATTSFTGRLDLSTCGCA